MTKEITEPLSIRDRADALGLHTYDTAIPIDWSREVKAVTGKDIYDVVWCYDGNSTWGYAVPLSAEATRILGQYHRNITDYVRNQRLIAEKDRADHLSEY
jgi:hypothetical protein